VEELLNELMSKAGLSADQAKSALGVVMGFMKDKLPADLMNQISGVFPDMGNMLGDAAGAVGDAGAVKDAGGGLADSIKKTFGG